MKKLFQITLIAIISISIFSCKASKTGSAKQQQKYYDEIGQGMCDCMNDLVVLMDKMEGLDENDEEALIALMGELQSITPKMETCVDDLEKKYPDLEEDEAGKDKVLDAIKRKCPKLHDIIKDVE